MVYNTLDGRVFRACRIVRARCGYCWMADTSEPSRKARVKEAGTSAYW